MCGKNQHKRAHNFTFIKYIQMVQWNKHTYPFKPKISTPTIERVIKINNKPKKFWSERK